MPTPRRRTFAAGILPFAHSDAARAAQSLLRLSAYAGSRGVGTPSRDDPDSAKKHARDGLSSSSSGRHGDRVFQEPGQLSGTPTARGHRQNVLSHACPSQRTEHVTERRIGLAGIPAVSRRLPEPMALLGEPENDERVEKHGQRGSPFDCLPAPVLRLLEAEALLAVTEGNFHASSHLSDRHCWGVSGARSVRRRRCWPQRESARPRSGDFCRPRSRCFTKVGCALAALRRSRHGGDPALERVEVHRQAEPRREQRVARL